MRAIFLGVALVATPTAAADQFDLVCKGGGTEVRYRVDLARGEACSGACDRIWKIGPATSGELKLIDRAPVYRGDLEERATVNRVTGEYHYFNQLSGLRPDVSDGHCEAASFTGFPASKF